MRELDHRFQPLDRSDFNPWKVACCLIPLIPPHVSVSSSSPPLDEVSSHSGMSCTRT
jgi:hypothetical protein